jgi:hypothetical protein
VIDIISRWFESNQLLQSLQMNSMGLGYRFDMNVTRKDMLMLLYGHLKSDFWSHVIEEARIANSNTPDYRPEDRDSAYVNLKNARTLGQKIDTSKGDILSQIIHSIHSKFSINSKFGLKMMSQQTIEIQKAGEPRRVRAPRILISASYQCSILPCLPLLLNELSGKCQIILPVRRICTFEGKRAILAWLMEVEERDDGEANGSKGLKPWSGPDLEEKTGGSSQCGEGIGEDDKGALHTREESGGEFSQDSQNGNATDSGDDSSEHEIWYDMDQDDGQDEQDENGESDESDENAENDEDGGDGGDHGQVE